MNEEKKSSAPAETNIKNYNQLYQRAPKEVKVILDALRCNANYDIIKTALAAPDSTFKKPHLPIRWAASSGHADLLHQLLALAPYNDQNFLKEGLEADNHGVLFLTSYYGDESSVKKLLNLGPYAQDKAFLNQALTAKNFHALCGAAENSHVSLSAFLLSRIENMAQRTQAISALSKKRIPHDELSNILAQCMNMLSEDKALITPMRNNTRSNCYTKNNASYDCPPLLRCNVL